MRGHRSAYHDLFDTPVVAYVAPERRGRSEEMLRKRNELILHRHYYYVKIVDLKFKPAIEKLEQEFFLTERTIVDMFSRSTLLKELNAKKPEVKYFKEKYPFMVW